jgi:hypothetical protein
MPNRRSYVTRQAFTHSPVVLRVLVSVALLIASLGWPVIADAQRVPTDSVGADMTGRVRLRPQWRLSSWLHKGARVEQTDVAGGESVPSDAKRIAGDVSIAGTQLSSVSVPSRNAEERKSMAILEDTVRQAVYTNGAHMESGDASGYPDAKVLDWPDDILDEEDFWTTPSCDRSECCLGTLLQNRLWLRSEYLLWWAKGSDTPALVTSNPVGTTPEMSGILGEPGTTTLFGDSNVTDNLRPGGRFTLGYWLTPSRRFGIEADYAFLGSGITRYRADISTMPILARPYYDMAADADAALLVAHPDFLSGSVAVDATNDFQSAELLWRGAMFQRCGDRLDFVVGYRFAQVDDGLAIHQLSEWTRAQGVIPAGTTKDITDDFNTTNQFHGGQLGVAYQERMGQWSVQMLAKLGLGNTHSRVQIDGRTITTLPSGISGTFEGGLLAQSSNIGTYERNSFSVMPELGVMIGYDITCRLRATFGYTFLYWSKVARPGDQIDTSLAQLPPEPTIAGGGPVFAFDTTDFWAQGMNFGLDYRF